MEAKLTLSVSDVKEAIAFFVNENTTTHVEPEAVQLLRNEGQDEEEAARVAVALTTEGNVS